MKKYELKGKMILPHNILFAITSDRDYEMTRIMLLEHMPDTKYDEYVLAGGYHCSCYGFDETEWDCTLLTREELDKILEKNCGGLRASLKEFWKGY